MTSAADRNQEVVRRLYEALDRHDGEAMAASYLPDARFRDPVFGELSGEQAGDMWRMLTGRSHDLRVELADHGADEQTGHAHWIARYTFTPTGRRVVNDVRAAFRFGDEGIAEHIDRFSFYAWARQALGPIGLLLGWTPLMPLLLRRRARRDLARFSKRRSG